MGDPWELQESLGSPDLWVPLTCGPLHDFLYFTPGLV